MEYFPLMVPLRGRPVVVFGGGEVAERKVSTLLSAGAAVTVVAPELTRPLEFLAKNRQIKHLHRPYQPGDLEGFILVFAATNNPSTNAQIAEEAKAHNLWVNVADKPELCSFILPALLTRGDLIIAVSTSGKSPALAKKIREDLETYFGPEYEEYLQIIARVRERALAEIPGEDRREELFQTIFDSQLLEWIRRGERDRARLFLDKILSEAITPEGADS